MLTELPSRKFFPTPPPNHRHHHHYRSLPMALRSGERKLSFDILALSEIEDLLSADNADDDALSRSHSDPPPLPSGAASPTTRRKKRRKNRKGKSPLKSDCATEETSAGINGDLNYSCTLSTVTEVASVAPDLDGDVKQVTLSSVYAALRQRNVGNGVNGLSGEVNSDDSGSSRRDDTAKEEFAENRIGSGKDSSQHGPEMNGRKLEKDRTLDWKELMAKDPNCKFA